MLQYNKNSSGEPAPWYIDTIMRYWKLHERQCINYGLILVFCAVISAQVFAFGKTFIWVDIYLHERPAGATQSRIVVDPERGEAIGEMFELVAYKGASGRKLAEWLYNEKGIRTRKGKKITLSMIYRMLHNPFYTGRFAWNGVMQDGDYESLVTKELFDEVQKLLDMNKAHDKAWGTKDFAFVRMMTCGSCGSGVTAEEKFKKLKNGTVKRYVYYRCTHSKDLKCKEKAIREDNLIEQLLGLIEKLDLDTSGVRKKLQDEMDRYAKFSDVLGIDVEMQKKLREIDGMKYAEYILREGGTEEKRSLLESVKSKILLKGAMIMTK